MIRLRVISSAWRRVIFRCLAMSSAVTNGSGVMVYILRLSALRARFHPARTRHKPHCVPTRFLNSHGERPNTSRLHDVQNDRLTLVERTKGYKNHSLKSAVNAGTNPDAEMPGRLVRPPMALLLVPEYLHAQCSTNRAPVPHTSFRRSGPRRLRPALLLHRKRVFVKRAD